MTQNQQLENEIKASSGVEKVNLLNKLASNKRQSDTSNSIKISQEAFELAQSLQYDKGMIKSCLNSGFAYRVKGDNDNFLKQINAALEISEKCGDNESIAESYGNIGLANFELKNYDQAEDYLIKSLELSIQIKAESIELECLQALAKLKNTQQNYQEAYDYSTRFANLQKKLFDQQKNKQISEMQTKFEIEQNKKEAEICRLKNVEVAKEISVRKRVESELQKYQGQLENLVKERTNELEKEIKERSLTESKLHDTTEDLKIERKALQEKNITLNQILDHLEANRKKERRKIYIDLEKAIVPFLAKLKKKMGEENQDMFELMEETINSILAIDMDGFQDRYAKLSSREIEICKYIKKGMTSKQICSIIHLSRFTVNKHREQIRKKLGITNKDINLSIYLRSH